MRPVPAAGNFVYPPPQQAGLPPPPVRLAPPGLPLQFGPVPLVLPMPEAPHAPQIVPNAPQMRSVDAGLLPHASMSAGTKRGREEGGEDVVSSQPVLKQARTQPAAETPSMAQQALFNAIDTDDAEGVQKLLRHSPWMLNAQLSGLSGETPLCRAAGMGSVKVLGWLCLNGAAVDASARNGATPLIYAAQVGQLESIQILLRSGADPNALKSFSYPTHSSNMLFSALAFAVNAKRLEVCKCLIEAGADYQKIQTNTSDSSSSTPLLYAISGAYTELIGWLLDTRRLTVDSVEVSTGTTLINAAAIFGATPTVLYLAARGANLEVIRRGPNGVQFHGVWMLAPNFRKSQMIVDLLKEGYCPSIPTLHALSSHALVYFRNVYELIGCWALALIPANLAQDGLRDVSLRENPQMAIESVAAAWAAAPNSVTPVTLNISWRAFGLVSEFIHTFLLNYDGMALAVSQLCGKGSDTGVFDRRSVSTYAQRLQMVIETISVACGSPIVQRLFSEMGLTPRSEEVMNQMVVLQRDLLLQGIAHLRARFDQQVASLPDLCMNTYISRSDRLNEADLYRTLTEDWGLYDPIARAVLRLVKDSYERLCRPATGMQPEFSALSPAEQLKAVMASVLEEWDKIPEIVAAIRDAGSETQMDIVSDLLFQQWRLFGEALGVTKERPLSIGPRRREEVSVDQLTVTD